MRPNRRNTILIALFVAVFVTMFVLESLQATTKPVHVSLTATVEKTMRIMSNIE